MKFETDASIARKLKNNPALLQSMLQKEHNRSWGDEVSEET
jgi:hypothetical protein